MRRAALGAMTLGGVGLGVMRWLSARRTRARAEREAGRWQVVTINRRPEEVVPDGRLPEPLARLGGATEVRMREAPGDRGTELGARLTGASRGVEEVMVRLGGQDPRRMVRRALWESRCLIETGEVLRSDEPVTRPVPIGTPLGLVTRHAGGEGRP